MPDFADTKLSLAGHGVFLGLITETPDQGDKTAAVEIGGRETRAKLISDLEVIAGDVVLVARYGSSRWITSIVSPADSDLPPTGSVVDVSSGNATVRIGGEDYETEIVPELSVSVDDVVLVQRRGNRRWTSDVVVEAAPPPEAANKASKKPSGGGDKSPNPKPKVRTGKLTVKPVATATFRNGSWRDDGDPRNSFDTFQGRYAFSSFGRQTGCAFYGNKPRNISGATVTNVTLRLKRLSGGSFAARRPRLVRVNQSTRPSGSPNLEGSAIQGPNLKPGQSTSFKLPNSWGQALVDGDSGGIAMNINSDSPYIAMAGRNSLSSAWTLVINWRRET